MVTQVVVLEKGGWTPAAELAGTERAAFGAMYEMGSLLSTQDAGALGNRAPPPPPQPSP